MSWQPVRLSVIVSVVLAVTSFQCCDSEGRRGRHVSLRPQEIRARGKDSES